MFQLFLGGGFKYLQYLIFTPKIEKDEPILTCIVFKGGWFNHQLFCPPKKLSNNKNTKNLSLVTGALSPA